MFSPDITMDDKEVSPEVSCLITDTTETHRTIAGHFQNFSSWPQLVMGIEFLKNTASRLGINEGQRSITSGVRDLDSFSAGKRQV